MNNPVELQNLRRRVEAMAQTGEYGSWVVIHTELKNSVDAALLKALFEIPTVKEGIDQVCVKARRA